MHSVMNLPSIARSALPTGDRNRFVILGYHQMSMSAIDFNNVSFFLGFVLHKTHLDGLSGVSLLLLLGSLDSSGLSLLGENLLSDLLLLGLVDGLNKNGLVLELVTLGGEVEVMVDILGDLLGLSVLLEESSKNSLSSHPEHL